MRFDSVAHGEDVAIVLHVGGHRSVTISQTGQVGTHPEPFWTLGAKTKAFKTETDTGLAMVVLVGLLVAFLATDPKEGHIGDCEYKYKRLRGNEF
jgi:hypothetical protein